MNLEKIQELYEFLKGEIPEGFTLIGQPHLSENEAFTTIYVLQEKFGLIPDHFEQCYKCKSIFDMDNEGGHYEDPGINLCDYCEDRILYSRFSNGDYENLAQGVKEWYKVQSSASKLGEEK